MPDCFTQMTWLQRIHYEYTFSPAPNWLGLQNANRHTTPPTIQPPTISATVSRHTSTITSTSACRCYLPSLTQNSRRRLPSSSQCTASLWHKRPWQWHVRAVCDDRQFSLHTVSKLWVFRNEGSFGVWFFPPSHSQWYRVKPSRNSVFVILQLPRFQINSLVTNCYIFTTKNKLHFHTFDPLARRMCVFFRWLSDLVPTCLPPVV